MKKHLSRCLITLLLAALFVTAIPLTAQAGPIEKTYKIRIADGIDEEIPSPDGSWIDDVHVVSGELPYGVVIGCKQDIMYIIGVPAFVGDYVALVEMEIGGGAYQYRIHIIVYDPNAPVTITKHPTGETVTEGESAIFISRADNASEIIWRLVSPDTATTINCADAPAYFPGLQVLGLGTETLTLLNIPLSLDGWKVEAKFGGVGGPVFSHGAKITVLKAKLDPPVINIHPVGADVPSGQSYTFTVKATAAKGNLRYQWYRAESDSANGFAIPGATGTSLTVTESVGDGYYYAGVWCEDGIRSSDIVLSNIAVLHFLAPPSSPPPSSPPPSSPPPEVSPSSQPDVEPQPTDDGSQPDPAAQPEQSPVPAPVRPQNPIQDNSRLYLLIALAAAVVLLIICIVIIILRRKSY